MKTFLSRKGLVFLLAILVFLGGAAGIMHGNKGIPALVTRTPLKKVAKYHFDISETGEDHVQAVLSWPGGTCEIAVSGTGRMIDFDRSGDAAAGIPVTSDVNKAAAGTQDDPAAQDEPAAWYRFQTMTTGWQFVLEQVHIAPGVTNVGAYAFANHRELSMVSLPDTVVEIGRSAFLNCPSLEEISFGGTMDEWAAVVLEKNWAAGSGIRSIHCADGQIALPPAAQN